MWNLKTGVIVILHSKSSFIWAEMVVIAAWPWALEPGVCNLKLVCFQSYESEISYSTKGKLSCPMFLCQTMNSAFVLCNMMRLGDIKEVSVSLGVFTPSQRLPAYVWKQPDCKAGGRNAEWERLPTSRGLGFNPQHHTKTTAIIIRLEIHFPGRLRYQKLPEHGRINL